MYMLARNASVLLQTASGIHAEHSPKYIRHVQMNKDAEVAQLIAQTNPYMVEESVWSSSRTDYCIGFPVLSPRGSLYKEDLFGTDLLKKVQLVQQNWVESGTNEELCACSCWQMLTEKGDSKSCTFQAKRSRDPKEIESIFIGLMRAMKCHGCKGSFCASLTAPSMPPP